MIEIVKLARAGGIVGSGRFFRTIIWVGHSLGSGILNGVIVKEPRLVDAAVFTGVRLISPTDRPSLTTWLISISMVTR